MTNKIKNILGKQKILLIVAAISVSSFFTISFVDNQFEVSKNLDIFATMFRELNIYYVDDTNPGELMKKGIDAMLESLDPYTNYIPESDIEDYRFMTTGEYGGVGALIRQSGDYVVIAEPYEGFPAEKAGLMAGDIILEINGRSAKGKSTSDVSKILKGQPNTQVKLLIKRFSQLEPFEKNVTRQEIKIDNVPYYGMIDEKTGYIKLSGFTETASKEFKEAFTTLKEKHNMKSLIFDLRGNGGGLLRESVNIVNVFVDKGQEVVSTKGKIKDWNRIHKALNAPLDLEMPVTVLTDRNSASASEIVSGALQDLDRAVIIGQRTFGKGLVQATRPLSYNSQMKITVAKYYIPSGRGIQKLDYAHRNEDGSVENISDSLIKPFKTKTGRIVYDAKGIAPDIETEERKYANITGSIMSESLVFDYATLYRIKHATIPSASKFKLTDAEYDAFVAFLDDKTYDYSTQTEKLVEKLKEIAEKEKYFNAFASEYEALRSKVKKNKKEDLYTFKEEIKQLLENEIVSRYYYQKGRIEASVKYDIEVQKALEVLENKSYVSILDGSNLTGSKVDKEKK
ncbi:MAG: S41 family peptidase [Bacteroidota bacterium]|nr:S41 family peptidase [Bacteroidota bacterium]